MRTEDVQSGQSGVGVGERTQGQRAPPRAPPAHGARVGEGGPPSRPTCGRAWPPVSSSWMCGGGEDIARILEPGVPLFCPQPRGVADAPSTPSPSSPSLPPGGP